MCWFYMEHSEIRVSMSLEMAIGTKNVKSPWQIHTNAVLPLLSDSFGSKPRFNNWCNNKSSPLSVAKHRLRGRSILPRASLFSVSNKTPSITGSFVSFKCCHETTKLKISPKDSECKKVSDMERKVKISERVESSFSMNVSWKKNATCK